MNVLKGVAEIEMLCLNSRENFEENKSFLRKRAEEEKNPVIRKLLERDQNFLDRIQVQMATARDFPPAGRGAVDHPGRLGGDCFSPYPFRAFCSMMLMGLEGW